MSEQDDKIFIKRFSLVLVALAVFTLVIIFLSIAIHSTKELSVNTAQTEAKLARLAPVGGVFAGDTGRAAAQAAIAAAQAAAPSVAFDGSLDGGIIYNGACSTCHEVGAAGAPQLIAAAWEGRIGQGRDVLVEHAINGIGTMPAKGGRADLTDEQVAASVDYMLAAVQ
ncbi:MAG: c-type cytochrome [Pseudomonadota bacterium]